MDVRSQRDIGVARSARYELPSPRNRNCAILTAPQVPLEYGKLFPQAPSRELGASFELHVTRWPPLCSLFPSTKESRLNVAIRRWFLGTPVRTMGEDDYGVREGGGNASPLE